MPDITITLTQAQVARLTEAWDEPDVPLRQSVLKALAEATKQKIRRGRQADEAAAYVESDGATTADEDAEFNW